MKNFFLLYTLLIIYNQLLAQRSNYEAEALWLPIQGATEKFTYLSSDTSMTPVGQYLWKLNYQNPTTKWFEVAHIKANFSNGLPEGEIEIVHYSVNFEIKDFDQQSVSSQTIGQRTLVKGKYTKGKPSGIWQYEYGAFDDKERKQSFSINTSDNTLNYNSDTTKLTGYLGKSGEFEGKWSLALGKELAQHLEYQKGILVSIDQNGYALFQDTFDLIKEQLKSVDSIASVDEKSPWLWNAGFQATDSIYQVQLPFAKTIDSILTPYFTIQAYFLQHPLISCPLITGVNRLYFKLDVEEQNKMESAVLKIAHIDSLLNAKLTLPVFQLHRGSNHKIDSLLNITEAFYIQTNKYKKLIENFLQENSRFIAPQYLPGNTDQKILTHNDYANYLELMVNAIEVQADKHIEDLIESIELLRLQGTVEELEEEWVFLKDDIQAFVPQDHENAFASTVYNRFVVSDFEHRKKEYALLTTYEERRYFLVKSIEYYEYFMAFFKNKHYQDITNVKDELTEKYTKYLYNPYMGVNNVEVVIKKKFLNNLLNHFWPFLLKNISQVSTGKDFQEAFAVSLTYKDAIIQLADDNSTYAKKLERRGRKETDMAAFEKLIIEYISSAENRE